MTWEFLTRVQAEHLLSKYNPISNNFLSRSPDLEEGRAGVERVVVILS